MNNNIIKINNVSKRFNNKKALDNISLETPYNNCNTYYIIEYTK